MKNAMIFLDVNRKINVNDYILKFKPLKNRLELYNNIYCIITDTQFLEDNKAVNNINTNIIENVNVLLNMGLNNKVKFVKESDCINILKNSNKLSNYVYVSKVIKSPYIKREIQQQAENSTKVASICNVLNLVSALVSFNVEDVYVNQDFRYVYELAQKIIRDFNIANKANIKLPNLVMNFESEQIIGLDGNAKVSSKFNNSLDIMLDDDDIRLKVNSIYTDPNHIKLTDKGSVDNNPLFVFIREFCDDQIVKKYFDINSEIELEKHYQHGGIGDAKLKKMLFEAICKTFVPLKAKIANDVVVKRVDGDTKIANNLSIKI